MRLPINWLKDFVEIKLRAEDLAEKLTLAGFETEVDGKVLVLEIPPNRGDCLSVLGIGREIGAIQNQKLKTKNEKLQPKTENLDKNIEVEISEPKICPRYSYRIIDGIKIGSSPKWMRERLLSSGFRPINNIVDVTNYVMIGLGQPLHAFDYDKIDGHKMTIRRAKKGESVVTLDGIRRDVDEEAIIIQDTKKLIDLAGIMGGSNSQVNQNTKTIVLQAAIFDPILIRRTSKKLGLSTEASYRYERGVDFQGTISALDYATLLVLETGGRADKIIDIQNLKWEAKKIKWSPERDVEKILGIKISHQKILEFLERLGIGCLWCSVDKNTCEVEIPSHRFDLKIPEDLVEEVARMYGYWRLPKTTLAKQKPAKENKKWQLEQKVKDFLVGEGFTQVENYPYLSDSDLKKVEIDPKKCLEIKNPISSETQFLRPSLLPSILKQIAKNPWASEIKMFEIGKVFEKNSERKQIAIASTAKNEKLKIKLEEVKSKILNKFKIRKKVYLKIADLDNFATQISLPTSFKTDFPKIKYRLISAFPPVVFDLAIIVGEETKEEEIEEVIKESSPLLHHLELFDLYLGPQLPKGKKSLAYHLTFSSYDHTLKAWEIKEIRKKIIHNLKKKLKVGIRGEISS